jgi:dihydrolipoamide dehydrogenase
MSDHGYIEVDEKCMTNISNVYAIGDIVKGPALAHKASYEGKVVAEVIAGLPSAVDYHAIPKVVFSDPEIASVGLTEKQAKETGYEVKVGTFPYGANGRALSLNASGGTMTIVVEKDTHYVLGAHFTRTIRKYLATSLQAIFWILEGKLISVIKHR